MKHGQLKGTTWVKHEDEKDILRMGGGSWTINLDELPKSVTDLEYWTGSDLYMISLADAHAHGFIRIMAGERKLVVPLKRWTLREEVIDI